MPLVELRCFGRAAAFFTARDHRTRWDTKQPSFGNPPIETTANPRAPSRQFAGVAVAIVLVCYLIGFAFTFPGVVTISDEADYVGQAVAFAQGHSSLQRVDPQNMSVGVAPPSEYPAGTSGLMTPLVALWGWRAGFLLGVLSMAACILVLALWLLSEGLSPLFALVFLAYPPAMVLSRCAMSDVPSAALVCCGLFLFWHGKGRHWRWWAASGFLAGASILLRETNPLVFVFLFLGALIRREAHGWALVSGGLAGLAIRAATSYALFGDLLFFKTTYPGFSLTSAGSNLGLYATALLVLIPGGLFFGLTYSGLRRWDVRLTLASYFLVYLFYDYNAAQSGGLKQWVLAGRFFVPLVPLLAFSMAHSVPKLCNAAFPHWAVPARATSFGISMLVVCAGSLSTAVHWLHFAWSNSQQTAVHALHEGTNANAPVITNVEATGKFFCSFYSADFGPRAIIDYRTLSIVETSKLLDRYAVLRVAVLLRGDSEHWKTRSVETQAWLSELSLSFGLRQVRSIETDTGEKVLIYELSSKT